MTEKVALSFRDRNPDVLTSIANLSNDEVFTPPEFANQMLDAVADAWAKTNDGENIWANPKVKFLDPFTKSGVFLREITRRLSDGLEKQMPDTQARVDHITKNQVFGIAITNLTSLLARRSVYCSKNANGKHSISRAFDNQSGNIWFERQNHSWVGGSNFVLTADEKGNMVRKATDGRCKYCGASQREYDRDASLESHAYALIHAEDPKALIAKLFGENMKFDVVIGNPPYQLSDGEDVVGASPIYNLFVNQAKKLEPRFLSMVIPARWYTGGKGLDSFRAEMISDKSIRIVEDFPDSTKVFPGTQIKGGVCYFLWDRDSKGPALVRNNYGTDATPQVERYLLEPGADVFIRFNEAVEILRKVLSKVNGSVENWATLQAKDSFVELVSSAKPFGIRTYVKGASTTKPGLIKAYQNGGIGFVEADLVTKGHHLVDKWKVFLSAAYGAGESFPHSILGKPFIGEPGSVCTETYNAIGPFETEIEANNALKYLSTKLFRFLVLLHKPTQHANQSVYKFVPRLDLTVAWSDEKLFEHFGITETEAHYIDSLIRPMELSND